MTPQQIKASICALFEAKEEDGILLVTTPLLNPGNDRVVAYISPSGNGKWLVDDNGETVFNLSLVGIDTASDAFNQSLVAWLHDSPVTWNEIDETLQLEVHAQEIGVGILAMAQAAAHIASSATTKQERERGEFKENLLQLLRSISVETGIAVEFDAPVAGALLHADCRFDTPVPTFIIAATSAVKLMEAELIHSQLQIRKEKGYVVAVVESAKKVGKMQFSRASYLTDRAVEFDASLFKSFLEKHLVQEPPLH